MMSSLVLEELLLVLRRLAVDNDQKLSELRLQRGNLPGCSYCLGVKDTLSEVMILVSQARLSHAMTMPVPSGASLLDGRTMPVPTIRTRPAIPAIRTMPAPYDRKKKPED